MKSSNTKMVTAARIVGMVALVCAAADASWAAAFANSGFGRPAWVSSLRALVAVPTGTTRIVNQGVGIYGNPIAAAVYWRPQHSGDCGEMAVADVVGQVSGNEPIEHQITAAAQSIPRTTGRGPIYRPRRGTDVRDLPTLLAHYGIQSTLAQSTIGGLEQDLAHGHKVIANVNAQTIWNQSGNHNVDNHVVVVTGIDANTGVVHLNDSGINTGRNEKVFLATFEKAWTVGSHMAVVTD
jgi:Peptidase_C39 like family